MGTNFYCRKIDRKHRKMFSKDLSALNEHISLNIDNPEINLLEEVNRFISDYRDFEKEIHLGKRSYGWQFLWDYHDGKYFNSNLNSIKEFLSQDGIIIYDEYENFYEVEQLFNDELSNCLYKDAMHDDGMDGKYSEYYFKSEDGLRFSKFEDFG